MKYAKNLQSPLFEWGKYPFVRLSLALIFGILGSSFAEGFVWLLLFFSLSAVYTLLFFIAISQKNTASHPFLGIVILLTISSLGAYLKVQSSPLLEENHLLNEKRQVQYYQGRINSFVSEKEKYFYADFEVEKVRIENLWYPKKATLRMYFPKDLPLFTAFSDSAKQKNQEPISSAFYLPTYGDRLLLKNAPARTRPPSNPNAFDFQRHLELQGIFHQAHLQKGDFIWLENAPPNAILHFIFALRRKAQESLSKALSDKNSTNIETNDEANVAIALLLGIKDGLDSELKQAYSGTGATHVLAVSGLHVGIIFQGLTLILGLLSKRANFMRYSQIFILIFLWFYAALTGFSPSVLRAVTMFSFVALGKIGKKPSNIYNSLALSAFILLLFQPNMLYELGFQLSYLALFGIVYLQPQLSRLIAFPKIDKKMSFFKKYTLSLLKWSWDLTTVALAAQVFTLPIMLYYFHQFPIYFWLSNFIVIPAASLIVGLGFMVLMADGVAIFLPFLSFLVEILAFLLKFILTVMNFCIVFIYEKFPFSVIEEVSFSAYQAIFYACGVFFLLLFWEAKRFAYLPIAFLFSVLMTFEGLQRLENQANRSDLVLYQSSRFPHLVLQEKDKAYIFIDSSLYQNFDLKQTQAQIEKVALEDWISKNIEKRVFVSQDTNFHVASYRQTAQGQIWHWKGLDIVWLHEKPKNALPAFQTDVLILGKKAAFAPEKLAKVKFRLLILEYQVSSQSYNFFREQAAKQNFALHHLREQGAYQATWGALKAQ
ncbi:ComEC/Rec2 family competence protein [Hugenholtzia roseola]|uniref:ComEC/Rec2 family competence protein n=1 Tax=Hugenholtzia roseola TaxID=1002 RepID=UPI0003FEAE80|nr:ComEC/Rec2 family competence protein [Hugenholtzia roseola]